MQEEEQGEEEEEEQGEEEEEEQVEEQVEEQAGGNSADRGKIAGRGA